MNRMLIGLLIIACVLVGGGFYYFGFMKSDDITGKWMYTGNSDSCPPFISFHDTNKFTMTGAGDESYITFTSTITEIEKNHYKFAGKIKGKSGFEIIHGKLLIKEFKGDYMDIQLNKDECKSYIKEQ